MPFLCLREHFPESLNCEVNVRADFCRRIHAIQHFQCVFQKTKGSYSFASERVRVRPVNTPTPEQRVSASYGRAHVYAYKQHSN